MAEPGPFGWFYQRGWWIEGAGVDPKADVFVSVHEHYHHRLQNSTSFGAVTYLLGRLADLIGDARRQRVSDAFTDACRRTQEGFATWASAAALGLGDADFDRYPDYRPHFEEMQSFASTVEGAYLRFHLCQAVARACMQSAVAELAATRGLDTLSLTDLRNVERPDHRLALLRRAGFDPAEAMERVREEHEPDDWAWMSAPRLETQMFDLSRSGIFTTVNGTFYGEVAAALRRLGCPTAATDGHLDWTKALIADAEALVGGGVGVEPVGPTDHRLSMWEVMRTCESEQVRLPGPLLPARMVDPELGVASMVAGTGDDAHLFLAIRIFQNVVADHVWLTQPPVDNDIGVFLRRSVLEADGSRVVEWMDVSVRGLAEVQEGGIDVISSVPESLMTSNGARQFGRHLGPDSTTLLADVRLAERLRYWAAAQGLFRVCFLSAASFGRSVPVMIGRFEMDGIPAHILLRPVTSAAVGCYRQVFSQVDPGARTILEDAGLLDDHARLITFSLAHLIGEETTFRVLDD